MEILKFSEPPKRSSRTKTQKRGGVMPLLAVAVSVAVIGGMSTTLAGTINIGTGTVEFGQGVVTTAACDTSITVTPESTFDATSDSFSVSAITLSNVGTVAGGTNGAGCLGKTFTLKAYDASNTLLNVDSATAFTSVFVTVPSDSATAASGSFTKTAWVGVTSTSGWDNSGSAGWTSAGTGTGSLKITGLKIPGSVTRITVESSQ